MSKFWGDFTIKGGFEVTTKHDLITGIITVVMVILVGSLAITNHLTGGIETASLSGLGMMFVYWFTRGSVIGTQNQEAPMQNVSPSPDVITQAVVSGVQTALSQVANTPAQGGVPNAGNPKS